MKEIVAIVPAAGGTRDYFGMKTKRSPLLRLWDGMPIVFHLFKQFAHLDVSRVYVGLSSSHEAGLRALLEAFATKFKLDLVIQEIPDFPGGLPATILNLSSLIPKNSSVLLNFGDTYCEYDFHKVQRARRTAIVSDIPNSEDWEIVFEDKTHMLLPDEGRDETNQSPGLTKVPCGIYWWADSKDFIKSVEDLQHSAHGRFASAIFAGENFDALPAIAWLDADHDFAFSDGKSRMQESRAFNSIEVNSVLGTVTKSSVDFGEKIRREVAFYQNIPANLAVLFPRLLDFNFEKTNSYQIEYYGYPTLAEIFLYRDLSPSKWQVIFSKLNLLISNHFQVHVFSEPAPWEEYFLTKTTERFSQLRATGVVPAELFQETLVINGEFCLGLENLLKSAEKILHEIPHKNVFSHGDLIFSNILCNPEDLTIRFIDPRGGLGDDVVSGPHLYDVAKLSNSVFGRYELIANDLFDLTIERDQVKFSLLMSSSKNLMQIQDAFLREFNLNEGQAKLLASLILLSIPLLHVREGLRSTAFLVQGLILGNEALNYLKLSS